MESSVQELRMLVDYLTSGSSEIAPLGGDRIYETELPLPIGTVQATYWQEARRFEMREGREEFQITFFDEEATGELLSNEIYGVRVRILLPEAAERLKFYTLLNFSPDGLSKRGRVNRHAIGERSLKGWSWGNLPDFEGAFQEVMDLRERGVNPPFFNGIDAHSIDDFCTQVLARGNAWYQQRLEQAAAHVKTLYH